MPSPTKPLTNGSRSSLSPDAAGAAREGRTPPPAPSAAYAKRAMEIMETEADDPVIGGSGYRRARAGTLPSSFQEARPAEAAAPAPPSSATHLRTSALSPAYPAATAPNPARPALLHTTSSAAVLDLPAANRARSGSLTMPEGGLGNGSSPFRNGWLSTPGIDSGPSRSPLGQPVDKSYPRSDSLGSLGGDDHIQTLDYLGLADGPQPASMSEMRSMAQRAIAQSGPASRHRASTVSNFTRPGQYRQSVTHSAPYSRDRSPYQAAVPDEELSQAIEGLGVNDPYNGYYYATAGAYDSRDLNRPRSTTVSGGLDNPMRRGHSGRSSGYLASIPQSPATGHIETHHTGFGYVNPRSYSERDLTRSRDSSVSRGPRHSHSLSSHSSRTGTPDFDKVSSTPQMPTRSLWIGNLDVSATSDALLQVFAPYGAIESVRLLPEKTCAFVNFMDRTDAVRARDDVLNRLGGQVAALSETAPVRIGFGKIDSAPNGPVTSTVAPTPPGLVFTNGSIGGAAIPPPVEAALPGSPETNTDLSTSPTRALWIGNIPGTTSSATLLQIFSPFGPVESARVLMAKNCGFINFERLDSAVSARTALNGREILGSDIGPIKIGFARVQTKSPILGGPEEGGFGSPPIGQVLSGLTNVEGAKAVSTEQQLSADGGGLENYRSPLVLEMVKNGVHEQVLEKGLASGGIVSEQQMIMQVLSGGRKEEDGDVKAAAAYRPPVSYFTTITGVMAFGRRTDVNKLKELRKRLDSGQCTLEEIDTITVDIMDESSQLASDYIGNTVIQKLFERCSPPLRVAMLQRVAPNLAAIGVHKNGTWAAQKIIECSMTDEERHIVTSHLRAFAPPLMCDSLGNYVCAGTLRFGSPYSDYVFDAMIDKMWDIAQNRFGARCMRTCLESSNTSLYQKKRISTGIILNSIPLATNPNGALLLTWLVDQSSLPGRYGLLANRFTPHIAHLCTHKLASLTVLRIITQTTEPKASATLISAIFASPNDETLIDVLGDANNGAQVIGKLIAISTLSTKDKTLMTDAARRVLPNIKASSTPPYRSLLEAVGLPVPTGPARVSPLGHRKQWNNQPHQPHQQHLHPHAHHQQAFQYGGFSQQPHHGYYGHHQQQMMGGQHGVNLSPLLVPQNMPLSQIRPGASPDPNVTPTPGHDMPTPVPHPRARLQGGSHMMMSPTSDPFNPFASPSIDSPYMPHHPGHPPVRLSSQLGQQVTTFEQQPNVGGLGIMGDQTSPFEGDGGASPYYQQQSLMGGMYAASGHNQQY